MKLKTVFFGTPEYAVPIMDYLIENTSLAGVVTRSDKMAGRYCCVTPSPVKVAALSRNIPVYTPEKLDDPEFHGWLLGVKPDVAVVLAYGKIIPSDVLKMFARGNINIHFSLLPAYRGAAPVQWAIINGEKETGITGFSMNEKLDSGGIICQKKIKIEPSDSLASLRERMVVQAAEVLKDSLIKIETVAPCCIQEGVPTRAPKLKKSDCKIKWDMPAEKIYNLVRGTKPVPCAFAELSVKNFKIDSLKVLECEVTGAPQADIGDMPPGSVVSLVKNIGFTVKCGEGFLLVKTVQPASKNVMPAWAFLQGHKLKIGDKLE